MRKYDKPVPHAMERSYITPGKAVTARPSRVAECWSRNVGKVSLVKVGPRDADKVKVFASKLDALVAKYNR